MTFADRYGPWALVAGASEGLGQAFAEALAERGLKLILLARRQEALDRVAASLRGQVEVRTQVVDLARDANASESIIRDHDIGLGVYNAAYAPIGRFVEQTLHDKLLAVDTNVRGPLTLVHALAPKLVARGKGGVILMSSLTAFWGAPFVATYGATKAFNLALGEALWAEMKPHGVDALVCCAGATRTPGFLRQNSDVVSMTPRAVVEAALRSLGKQPSMVPGAFNTFASWLMNRLLPRATAIGVMGRQTEKLLPSAHFTHTHKGGPLSGDSQQ
jgi:uncharacterized protein